MNARAKEILGALLGLALLVYTAYSAIHSSPPAAGWHQECRTGAGQYETCELVRDQ